MRPACSRLAVLAALALLLAGCGQRGPLYLPGQTPPKKRLSQLAPPPARARAAKVTGVPSPATVGAALAPFASSASDALS